VRPEGLGKNLKIHLIGYRTRDLPVCSIYLHTIPFTAVPFGKDRLLSMFVKLSESFLTIPVRALVAFAVTSSALANCCPLEHLSVGETGKVGQ
jgi:hypothetical protein